MHSRTFSLFDNGLAGSALSAETGSVVGGWVVHAMWAVALANVSFHRVDSSRFSILESMIKFYLRAVYFMCCLCGDIFVTSRGFYPVVSCVFFLFYSCFSNMARIR